MKQKQSTSTIYKRLILPCLISACVIGFSGCGNNSLDSDENRTLLESSSLFSLELKNNNLSKYVEGSWIAVQPYYNENNDKRRSIISCSESSLDENVISTLDNLIINSTAQSSAQYKSTSGKVSTGTGEYASIYYYDAHTGDCYGDERLSAGAFPKSTSGTPHYTISDRKIREAIEKRLNSRIDPDYATDAFVMDGTVLLNVSTPNHSSVTVPEYIMEISVDAGDSFRKLKDLSSLSLPNNIEIINLPNLQAKVTFGVYKGSYAEQYAIENGYVYFHIGTLDGYLPEGVYEYDKVHYSSGYYGYLHIPGSVSYIRDGLFSTNNAMFVVNEGAYAEQMAIESQHIYCYEGQQDCVFVPEEAYFFIPEKDVELTSVIHLPGNVYIYDQMDGYLKNNATHLTFVVPKDSYAESYAIENKISVLYEDGNSY
jgi:predicted small secreted protein